MTSFLKTSLIFICCSLIVPEFCRANQSTVITRTLDLSSFSKDTKNKIYEKIPALKGSNWTTPDLDLLMQFLVIDEKYDSAQVMAESDTSYKVVVAKIKRIHSLHFSGIHAVDADLIRRETGLAEKMAFDPSDVVEASERIRTLYETWGFPKTQVDGEYAESSAIEVDIKITVKEGPQTRISAIRIESPNLDLKTKIEKNMKSWVKEPLTDATLADLRSSTRDYLSSHGFWRAELSEPKVRRNFEESEAELTFTIQNPTQYFFETEGDKKIQRGEIGEFLHVENYFSNNPSIAGEMASKTKAYYLSKGFARVEVDGQELDGVQNQTKKVHLKITEGPKVKIEKMIFQGSISKPPDHYKDFVESHASSEIQKGNYVKDDFDDVLKNLTRDLWNQGFLRAKIVSTRALYNKEKTALTLQVNLDEGPLTLVRKISFSGNQSLSSDELLKILKFRENEPLKLNVLETAIASLKDSYRAKGFLEMTLVNEQEGLLTYNEDNTVVDLNFMINEGPQVRVSSILVEGNSLTREEIILKELDFKIDDVLTPQLIDESTSRLQRLGFFNSVDIKTLEEKTKVANRTVIVRVSDRDPGLVNAGVGLNNERGLTVRGYTGVGYRNILGTGRGGSLRLDGNYNVNDIRYLERKITLGYVEPYLLNTRVRGRINLSRSTSISDFNKKLAAEVNQTTWSLEQDITSHLAVTWDVLNIATIRDFDTKDNSDISSLTIGSTALTTDLDYRDHPFVPTRGSLTRLNLEYGAPSLWSTDTIEYGRAYGMTTHYQKLGQNPNFVWANSLRGGYLKNLSSRSNGAVPYDKKGFLLGGQSTIRGYTPDEAFPNKFDFDDDNNKYLLKKSVSMVLFKSEVRFPLGWTNVGGAAFYDGGQVYIDCEENDSLCKSVKVGWRDTIGLAFRYILPVGALSIEYGWKIKPIGSRNENPSALHLSIGTF